MKTGRDTAEMTSKDTGASTDLPLARRCKILAVASFLTVLSAIAVIQLIHFVLYGRDYAALKDDTQQTVVALERTIFNNRNLGLAIALPTMAFYNHFTTRVQSIVIEMERISLRMVAVLKRLK